MVVDPSQVAITTQALRRREENKKCSDTSTLGCQVVDVLASWPTPRSVDPQEPDEMLEFRYAKLEQV